MVLHEKGITDWLSHHVDLFKGEQFDPDYIKLNPKAQTPTLVHDGKVIRESSIICEYIDDVFKDPSLKPENPADIARMREWIKISDDHIYEAAASLSFITVFRQVMSNKGEQEKESQLREKTDLGRVMRQRSCMENGVQSHYVIRSTSNLLHFFSDVEKELSDRRPWLMGEDYSLAEINISPYIARVEALNLLDFFISSCPLAEQWWERCKSRESYLIAEVGPAQGEEANFYYKCGSASRNDLSGLIEKIKTMDIYDLATLAT